jgi:hypothetical protein
VKRFGEAREPALREPVAVNKAFTLGTLRRSDEAIASYDEVLRLFGEVSEPEIQESVARASEARDKLLGADQNPAS